MVTSFNEPSLFKIILKIIQDNTLLLLTQSVEFYQEKNLHVAT